MTTGADVATITKQGSLKATLVVFFLSFFLSFKSMISNNRIVVVAIALTVAATFYSLSELHRISSEHTDNVKRAFDTHSETAHKRDRHTQGKSSHDGGS